MALASTLSTTVAAQAFEPGAEVLVTTEAGGIELLPATADFAHELRVALPDGTVQMMDFAPGEIPAWSAATAAGKAAEGLYTYELRAIPAVLEHRFDAAGDDRGLDSTQAVIATGSFTILEGTILSPDRAEPTSTYKSMEKATVLATNDGVIRESLCVGSDCPDSPTFGFDTIRVQEDNTRFHFDDASTASGYPANDWRLVANDSGSGGANYFGIEDATSGRRVFSVSAGAPSNALFVGSSGRVGLGTATPVLDIHIAKGNTPSVRLDQTTSGGFTAQVWDMAGNEANFFVRDVTNGSRLPLRIRPGAPTSSIDISAPGNVGMGTSSPSAPLHVRRSNGTAQILVEESFSNTIQDLFTLKNNGQGKFVISNTSAGGAIWDFSNRNNGFNISRLGTGGQELLIRNDGEFQVGPGGAANFVVEPDGDIFVTGSLVHSSSRETKEAISPVDGNVVLAKLEQLEVAEWTYKKDNEGNRHLSPMAEDFHALFGLGPDAKHVAPSDLAGVALAAAKALKAENEALKSDNWELRARLERIESKLGLAEE